MNNKKFNVLITGGAGFIGSHLVKAILKRSDLESVVVVDNLSMSDLSNIGHIKNSKFKFVKGDITNYDLISLLLNRYNIDTVFHLAVSPLVYSLKDPKVVCNNIIGMQKVILECQRNRFFNKLITFSTSEVYGSSEGMNLNENDHIAPRTPYAAAKAACDLLTQSYGDTFNINYTIIRPFNNYGPGKQVFVRRAGIIPTTIDSLSKGEYVNIFGDGSFRRDFVYVEDTVRATLLAWRADKCKNQVINIASGVTHTISDIVNDIAKLMQITNPKIRHVEQRRGDVSYLCGDGSKAKKLLGFTPEITWREGLKKCIIYYSNPQN